MGVREELHLSGLTNAQKAAYCLAKAEQCAAEYVQGLEDAAFEVEHFPTAQRAYLSPKARRLTGQQLWRKHPDAKNLIADERWFRELHLMYAQAAQMENTLVAEEPR